MAMTRIVVHNYLPKRRTRDGGPGSGPQPGGGGKAEAKLSKAREWEASGAKHLPPAAQKEIADIHEKIRHLESQPFSEKLDQEYKKLDKRRNELGWQNPFVKGILGGRIGG